MDRLIKGWLFADNQVAARRSIGTDGRNLLQLRVDLGILQLEVGGRPDGGCPGGFSTYYDLLIAEASEKGDDFELTEEHCKEIDREFAQFYHRRVAWLALREFDKAVDDVDHTLAMMDFSTAHAPDEEWIELHEQYRPFVLFHRAQAETLGRLAESDPENALMVLDLGLVQLQRSLEELDLYGAEDESNLSHAARLDLEADQDEFVDKLRELRRSIMLEYELGSPLADQLAEAIAGERYELAAKLRDRIAKR